MLKKILRLVILLVALFSLPIFANAEEAKTESKVIHSVNGKIECYRLDDNKMYFNQVLQEIRLNLMAEKRLREIVTIIEEKKEKRAKTVFIFASLDKMEKDYKPTESVIYTTDCKEFVNETIAVLTKEIEKPYRLIDISKEYMSEGKVSSYSATLQREL